MKEHDCEEELQVHQVLFEHFSCEKCGYEAFIRAEKDLTEEDLAERK